MFISRRNPESSEKSLKAWFYMNCLRRAVTIIIFPWEHSCLVWTKFTVSRICNNDFYKLLMRCQPICITTLVYLTQSLKKVVLRQAHTKTAGHFTLELEHVDRGVSRWSALFLNHCPELFTSNHHKCYSITTTACTVSQNWTVTIELSRCYHLASLHCTILQQDLAKKDSW